MRLDTHHAEVCFPEDQGSFSSFSFSAVSLEIGLKIQVNGAAHEESHMRAGAQSLVATQTAEFFGHEPEEARRISVRHNGAGLDNNEKRRNIITNSL